MPLPASPKEQPQAAKATTVSVEKKRSNRRRAQVLASSTVVAQTLRADRTWEMKIAARYDGLASAASALSKNQETDENPSTTSERGVSATRPWRAKVLAKARVIAPSSHPWSAISEQTTTRAANCANVTRTRARRDMQLRASQHAAYWLSSGGVLPGKRLQSDSYRD